MIATALAHALLISTPRPRMFFTWIIVLATVAGAAAPFVIGSEKSSQVATACINLALGICVLSLLRSVMARTVRPGAAHAYGGQVATEGRQSSPVVDEALVAGAVRSWYPESVAAFRFERRLPDPIDREVLPWHSTPSSF
jgi:hypothetical protein